MKRNVLFNDDAFSNPETIISQHTEIEGGLLKIKMVGLIDGKLTGVSIISTDDSPIKISALAVLEGCVIECHDLLVEGTFSGQIRAKGDVELGESALVQGEAIISGTLVMSPLADSVDLKVNHALAKTAAYASEPRSGISSSNSLKLPSGAEPTRAI